MAKNYISSLDGKAKERDATNNWYIQEAYVANLKKLEEFNM